MKPLTKKQRNEIYKKALEIAHYTHVQLGGCSYDGFLINQGLCCVIQEAHRRTYDHERYCFWVVKDLFPEFAGFYANEYSYEEGFRIIVLQLCIEMTNP